MASELGGLSKTKWPGGLLEWLLLVLRGRRSAIKHKASMIDSNFVVLGGIDRLIEASSALEQLHAAEELIQDERIPISVRQELFSKFHRRYRNVGAEPGLVGH
jgi:hypothetical protein